MDALLNKIDLFITFALQLFILRLLIKRRLRNRFVWFFSYIVYELCESVLRFAVPGNTILYFTVFWITEIVDVVLSVMAVRESFLNVFRIHTGLRWFTRIVWICVALALSYATFRAWALPPIRASRLTTVIVGLDVAVQYSVGAVGILYFGMMKFFKIERQQWESGIVSGFMTIAILSVVSAMARSLFGPPLKIFNEWLPPVAYVLAEIEWAFVLWRPEKEPVAQKQELTKMHLTNLEGYIILLRRLLRRRS